MSISVLDVETGPLLAEKLAALMPVFEADKRLKDPEKIAADIVAQKVSWVDKAALSATTGEILAIGMLHADDTLELLHGRAEHDLISTFWHQFRLTTGSFVGHNLKGFDIPFLMRRSWVLGVQVPPGVIRGRYLNDRFIDTMELWSCGNYRDTISLSNLAKSFGVGAKNGNGAEFANLYKSGPDGRDKALAYLKNDIELTAKCAQKMGIL